jgi:hypothetical protein
MIVVNEISVLPSYDGWIDALKRALANSTRPKAEFFGFFKCKPFLDAVLSIVFQMENYG